MSFQGRRWQESEEEVRITWEYIFVRLYFWHLLINKICILCLTCNLSLLSSSLFILPTVACFASVLYTCVLAPIIFLLPARMWAILKAYWLQRWSLSYLQLPPLSSNSISWCPSYLLFFFNVATVQGFSGLEMSSFYITSSWFICHATSVGFYNLSS